MNSNEQRDFLNWMLDKKVSITHTERFVRALEPIQTKIKYQVV